MFERIFEILMQIWHHLVPFQIIVAYQNAGVMRFGKYHRTMAPGIHWKIPFVEEINTQDVTITTMRMPAQTLTTKDGKSVIAAVIVKYSIKDVEPYITLITDQKDVLIDVTMGAVFGAIQNATWAETLAKPPVDAIVEQVRKQVNRYGFKIEAITFTDLGQVRSIRLIQPHAKDLSN